MTDELIFCTRTASRMRTARGTRAHADDAAPAREEHARDQQAYHRTLGCMPRAPHRRRCLLDPQRLAYKPTATLAPGTAQRQLPAQGKPR